MCAAASATPTHPITKASKSDSKWAALIGEHCVRESERRDGGDKQALSKITTRRLRGILQTHSVMMANELAK